MAKKLAAVQSCYIPWKGYFDLINSVDEFILFDDVQYTRRDWRNRNLIKTPNGVAWLTIPVAVRGQYLAPIRSITTSDSDWARRHWKTIVSAYSRAPFFKQYEGVLQALYLDLDDTFLSFINRRFIDAVCTILGITTHLTWSMDYELRTGKSERLIALCQQAGADVYVSGPSARGYIDEALFAAAGIRVEFFDYSGYPEYPQLYPPFDHQVSVLDLLFHTGPAAAEHMLTFAGARVSPEAPTGV